jgi:hypothetical protein
MNRLFPHVSAIRGSPRSGQACAPVALVRKPGRPGEGFNGSAPKLRIARSHGMVGPLRARKGSKSGIHSYSTSVSGWAPEGPKVCQFKGLNSTLMLVVGKDRCGGCVPSDALRCVHAPATDEGAAAATARLVARRGGVLRERALVVTPPRTRPQSAARRRRTQLSDRRGSTRTRFDDCQSWDADRAHRSGPPTYGNGRQRTPFRVRLLTVTVGNVNGRAPHTSVGRVQSWT